MYFQSAKFYDTRMTAVTAQSIGWKWRYRNIVWNSFLISYTSFWNSANVSV